MIFFVLMKILLQTLFINREIQNLQSNVLDAKQVYKQIHVIT